MIKKANWADLKKQFSKEATAFEGYCTCYNISLADDNRENWYDMFVLFRHGIAFTQNGLDSYLANLGYKNE